MTLLLTHLIAQAEVVEMVSAPASLGDPNMTVIGVIVAVFLILLIWLLLPTPKKALGEDSEEKPAGALPEEELKHDLKGEKEEKGEREVEKAGKPEIEEKPHMSLTEIKLAKRDEVTKGKSADELRELRKERRAAIQTEKAIQEREESEKKQEGTVDSPSEETSLSSEVSESSEQEILAHDEEGEVSDADVKEAESGDSLNAEAVEEENSDSNPIDDIVTKSDADAGDVYASLFASSEKDGDKEKGDLKFDELDDVIEGAKKAPQEPVFPMLGSKLIPLNEITSASEEEDDGDLLNGLLSKRNAKSSAEKKTLS